MKTFRKLNCKFILLALLGACGSVWAISPAFSAIVDAISKRDLKTVQSMLLANTDGSLLKEKDASDQTLLHFAAGQGDVRILKAVMLAKPVVDAKTKSGQTPLFYACLGTYQDNARILLRAKATVNLKDNLGMTPLLIVCDKGKPKMAKDLIGAGAKVNVANKSGTTPLMYAAERGNRELAKLLIGAKAKIDAVDSQGNTALHYAARRGRNDMIPFFLKLLNVKNKAGQTPLDIAMLSGKSDFARDMQKYGGQVGK